MKKIKKIINLIKLNGFLGSKAKLQMYRKFLDNNDFDNLRKHLDKLMMSNIEYIWYCPRRVSCGAIVLKTNKPILPSRGQVKCKRCNEVITYDRLMVTNKKNIKKFLDELDKKVMNPNAG